MLQPQPILESNQVTYSPALTLVPTYECFNRCSYCNFRVDPDSDRWLSVDQAQPMLAQAQQHGVIEILVLSGEVHPQSSRRTAWLQRIYDLCALALRMGFLPHTNVGPLSLEEMAYLKQVNVSMGLMVEQVTPALLKTVHRHAPSKHPSSRLEQLHQAGELAIPFTTGLLLGIGESPSDRIDTLKAIATCHDRWGHIQEVILQPHQPGQRQTQMGHAFSAEALANFVTIARRHLPPEIVLQVPPNLITSPQFLQQAIANGAHDLGGLSPVDEVNPDYPHPHALDLAAQLNPSGWTLMPRLPIYPAYDHWLAAPLRTQVMHWRQRLAQPKPTGRDHKQPYSNSLPLSR